MKRVVVRYKVKSDRVAEHEALLRRVFEQLSESRPGGLRYEVIKLADGLSFMHTASISVPENPLLSLSAFKEFSSDIKSRCDEPPVSTEASLVAEYSPAP